MLITLFFLAAIFILVGIVFAAKIKGNLKIAAQVPMMCTLAISPMNFGSYIGETYGTGAMSVNCGLGVNYTISIGTGGSGTYDPRQMNNGASGLLNYNLYTESTYATIWENATVSGIGTDGNQDYTIYGRILAGQNVPAGNYSDNLTITIEY
ncbi:MAG: spore coat U domain-containing protein [Proteobacteria bacterium]|nr:spore coat U domain-containing protein [Pseudomonadota bacterium]